MRPPTVEEKGIILNIFPGKANLMKLHCQRCNVTTMRIYGENLTNCKTCGESLLYQCAKCNKRYSKCNATSAHLKFHCKVLHAHKKVSKAMETQPNSPTNKQPDKPMKKQPNSTKEKPPKVLTGRVVNINNVQQSCMFYRPRLWYNSLIVHSLINMFSFRFKGSNPNVLSTL